MRHIAVIIWFATVTTFAALPVLADSLPTYTLVKEKSSLKFIALQNSAPVQGVFEDYNATVVFDPEKLDQSSITAEVMVGSVKVTNEDVQKNIVLPDWLSVEAFPKAAFKSTKFSRTPMTDSYYVEGDLTLRGKTVPVTLNFHLQMMGDVAVAKGYATLQRTDFGIGQGEWKSTDVIKNEVRVEFRILVKKSS